MSYYARKEKKKRSDDAYRVGRKQERHSNKKKKREALPLLEQESIDLDQPTKRAKNAEDPDAQRESGAIGSPAPIEDS